MESSSAGPPLEIVSITDANGRIEALVRVREPGYLRTSIVPDFARRALQRWPGLARHRCETRSPHGIAAELADTETPHAVEHIALELMVAAGAPRALRGETRWDFAVDGPGVFRVSLAYRDPDSGFDDRDLAEVALRDGARAVGELLAGAAGEGDERAASPFR